MIPTTRGDHEASFMSRWQIRRAFRRPVEPDVEQELRVQRFLYSERRVVERVERPHHFLRPVEGTNLLAMDRASHDRLHRGEDPHRP